MTVTKDQATQAQLSTLALSNLTGHLRGAVLPGDTPFSSSSAKEAARFLLDAAMTREPERSSLVMDNANEGKRAIRLAIINDDMPFLVDSIAATIAAQGLAIDRLVHPIVPVERGADGTLVALHKAPKKSTAKPEAGAAIKRESMIYIEIERADARQGRDLERRLKVTLGDVRASVTDWPKVQSTLLEDAASLQEPENAALLHWFNEGMLTQLGHLVRGRDGKTTKARGICRKSSRALLADASYDRSFAWFEEDSTREILIVKANALANVHRRVPLDLIIIPRRAKSGRNTKVEALSVHAGVWTSAALASPPVNVPVLRVHLQEIAKDLGFESSGHAGKALVHALTAIPHDLLLALSRKDIARVATTMMGLVDRPRPRLALVEAPLARHLFGFVWLPRDLLSTQSRQCIEDMLTASTGAQMLDWSLEVEGGNLAMLRFVLDIRQAGERLGDPALEAQLVDLLRGWDEAVERELAKDEEHAQALALSTRYASAFPPSYRAAYTPRDAAIDIQRLRHLADSGSTKRDVRLFALPRDEAGELHLTIYQQEGELNLSDAVPALENFGFRVQTQVATRLDDGALGEINDFSLTLPDGSVASELLERAPVLEKAVAAVLNGDAEDCPFNRLIVGVGLSAIEANWLRAFYRYLRQTGMGFTIYTVVDALYAAPQVTKALMALFSARHDPSFDGSRERAAQAARTQLKSGLSQVAAINDDRLLRLYHSIIEAILRTNAFAPAAEEALAFKFDSSAVPALPKPVPWREIFVYSSRVEGIHLRSGPIARGGLRWSDRRDDFRTEILGLMKAQKVKNAVIVPAGAKGGFYPKLLPNPQENREAWAAEGQASYEIFIRTLLSITDNIVGGKTVHPPSVAIHDGEDPYFVVAADKGTARFSDIANAIAQKSEFWLGDAFASGGSNGYDHKAMGITARGAWVSVQRHFLEQGVDVQADPIRVAGCGDMSGDVFGNGMLLSKAIQLVAAFDHRHIFIDPDPDPATSWTERKRLYDLPRSSWDDYAKERISKGGGVFSRSAKSITLSKAACQALDLEVSEWEPEALISAILKSPLDLIWFGGIGTYIKAEAENNIQVGDPGNDALRVNARDVRAKAIGEGANLGITQAGRIEFASRGGRINTDFIDNSAGVDCSDNEVNIKIALQSARQTGKLSEKKRNALLVDMTDEVAAIVLEDNRLQALALSIAEAGGSDAVGSYLRLIETLEEHGELDRATEGLADNESFVRRVSDGRGLMRPELAVLLSSTKLSLQDAIESSDLTKDALLETALLGGFPSAMRQNFVTQIGDHRLRCDMIATELANRMVNRLGLLPPFELAEEESVPLDFVASAFVAADHLFEVGSVWRILDEATMPEPTRIQLFERIAVALRGQIADLLRLGAGKRTPSELVAELQGGVAELRAGLDTLLAGEAREQSEKMLAEMCKAGAPNDVAKAVTQMFELDGSAALAHLAVKADISPSKLTGAFSDLGIRLGLDWAQGTAAMMEPSDVWERLLVAGLARDFHHMRLDFLQRLLRAKASKADPAQAVANWAKENAVAIHQFRSMVERAQMQTAITPAVLAQIASQARNLLER